jgi:glutamyl-tRNA synthetase
MAPSPTGHLHVGTARTALFNYLFAKRNGGQFLMRSEDTDKERSQPEYEVEIMKGLEWLGLSWDGFCRQSERTEIYRGYLERAIENGKAYLSKEASKREPGTEVEVVRLKNPNREIVFEDVVRGEISFDTTELGDFVVARSLDDALYHFTVVVDDHEMGVTHVIRGEDHISNTPRQILIQEAIGAERPVYAHLPLLLGKDKSKLSKRHGTVQLTAYQEAGYLNTALVNYLALLGWNPGTDQEVFSMDELMQAFDLSGVQKGGAIFDTEKLAWFNKEHLDKLRDEDYLATIEPFVPQTLTELPQWSEDRFKKLLPTIRERVRVLNELTEAIEAGEYDFAFKAPAVDLSILAWKNDSSYKDALPRLQHVAELISTLPEEAQVEEIKDKLWSYAEKTGKGEVLWPLRVALTGRERSPDPFTVIHILGSAEAYKRVRQACDTILSA